MAEDEIYLSPHAEAELQRLIGRSRMLMARLNEKELAAMIKTTDALLGQWEWWIRVTGESRPPPETW